MKKKLLLSLFATLFVLSSFATGETFVDPASGLTFKVIADFPELNDYELELVRGSEYYSGDIVIPDKIKLGDHDYVVTAIAESVFFGCRELKSVVMPNTIKKMGVKVFANCYVENVILSSSLKTIPHRTFYYAYSLRSLDIPEGVEEIGDRAFVGCSSMEYIRIPKSLKTMGMFNQVQPILVFLDCYKLEKVIISDLKAWLNINFEGGNPLLEGHHLYLNDEEITDLVIPEGISIIPKSAFSGGYFKSLTLPESVKQIGYGAFGNCVKLQNIISFGSVTSLEGRAFSDCSSLEEINIPHFVEKMDDAFWHCRRLKAVSIPSSLTSFSDFAVCDSLESITVYNNGTVNYDSRGNCNAVIKTSNNELVRACKNTIIPEGIEILSDYPSDATSIVFPKSLKTINTSFYYKMRDVEAKWEDLSTLSYSISYINQLFNSSTYNSGKLIVPVGKVDMYKNTEPWSNFTTIVEKSSNGIRGVHADSLGDTSTVNSVYNLNGQRITKPSRGLYIINGRKVTYK